MKTLEQVPKRALRRHHLRRRKAAVRLRFAWWWGREEGPPDPGLVAVYANNRGVCSCEMCGNQRKVEGPPIQELRPLGRRTRLANLEVPL